MQRRTVLIVDDAPEVVDLLRPVLERDGFSVVSAASGAEALSAADEARPDVVLLDVGLPDIDGISVAGQLRSAGDPSIIFLSARGEDTDRIMGLAAGGDDYVVKPFSPLEVALRVKAVLRRREPSGATDATEAGDGVVSIGRLSLDRALREVRVGGEPVALTRIEFDLLEYLMHNPRQVLTRDQIMDEVWGPNWIGARNVLDGHVSNLRRKLGDDAATQEFVVAVHGVGYRLGPCDLDEG